MRKTRKAAIALLLLFWFLFAFAPEVIPLAKGYDEEHPPQASNLYSTEWQVGEPDLSNVTYALSSIYDMFDSQIYYVWAEWWPYTPVLEEPVYENLNNFEAQTTDDILLDQVDECEDNHPFTTVFYYGHMGMNDTYGLDFPYWNYGFIEQAELDDPMPDIIWDYDIYYVPTVENHHFIVLWVCNNGNIGGATNPLYGMPRCWTRHNLSPDGYGDPLISGDPDNSDYCFISFEGASPGLGESMEVYQGESGYNNYRMWLLFFYAYMLGAQESVQDALDDASTFVGYNYGWLDSDNRLRMGWDYYWPGWLGNETNKPEDYPDEGTYEGKMRIYGDGYINLPVTQNYWIE